MSVSYGMEVSSCSGGCISSHSLLTCEFPPGEETQWNLGGAAHLMYYMKQVDLNSIRHGQ